MQKLSNSKTINSKQVRLIDNDNTQIGIIDIEKALSIANEKNLDLVLVNNSLENPVCKIMDFSKHKFEQEKIKKKQKKNNRPTKQKEIYLSCRIDNHDIKTKVKNARKFIENGNKVNVIVRFKGREVAHPELGQKILDTFFEECSDIAKIDKKFSSNEWQIGITLSAIK